MNPNLSKVRRLAQSLRSLPADLKNPARRGKAVRLLICAACIIIIAAAVVYMICWTWTRERIERESALYSEMYTPSETPVPTSIPEIIVTALPTVEDAPLSSAAPSPLATVCPLPTADPTTAPTEIPTDAPTEAPTEAPTDAPTDVPTAAPTPVVTSVATPDSNTLVFAIQTPPPVQESFSTMLAFNPDTVAFLKVGDIISLPVVQRPNDNSFYLDHSYDGKENPEGTLFLDGLNLLIPEDDCLIVYGHNMNNGTMFGKLRLFHDSGYFRNNPTVSFDTLYENRLYVPFAAFSCSMNPDSRSYFDVRQFVFDADGFDRFVYDLRRHSAVNVDVNVRYGDRLLLLVTCDYTDDDSRFILALRQLRDNETEADAVDMLS